MGVKAARESFTREEVDEILRRNVALYKEDPGFAEYFAGLTMYLMEHQQEPRKGAPARPPAPPVSAAEPDFTPRRSNGDVDLRAFLRRPPAPPSPTLEPEISGKPRPFVQKHNPTSSGPLSPDPTPIPATVPVQMTRPNLAPPPPPPPPPSGEIPVPPPEPAKRISNVRAAVSPFLTPLPTGKKSDEKAHEEPKDDQPAPPLGDRTKVYRVARTYRSSSIVEQPCQECGAMLGYDVHRCPRCGRVQ